MQKLSLFETPLWMSKLNIDLENLEKSILKFSNTYPSKKLSNIGGYQGHNFVDETLNSEIIKYIPTIKEKPIENFSLYTWVNINSKSHKNERHCHMHTDIFLSGVFYVKVPENSGYIRFYDPRGHLMQMQNDYNYFYGGYAYQYIKPEPNMIMFFPSWLEHDVETNDSDEDRISIAFNISNK